ncbi:MAG: hypothetical protein JWP73_99 [Phenylobacterium sp.]|nr:hypothetical protein [Phenylobacterium sp.]
MRLEESISLEARYWTSRTQAVACPLRGARRLDGINFHFSQAGLFDKGYRDLPAQLSRPELMQVTLNFVRNCDRVFRLQAALVNVVINSIWLMRVDRELRLKLSIPFDENDATKIPGYTEDAQVELTKLLDERKSEGYKWSSHWDVGANAIEQYMTLGMLDEEGIVAVLSSMIVGGWMCFESLASDLWLQMVNMFPKPLAGNVLAGKVPPVGESTQREQKSLSMDVFEQYGFNLSSHMGDILFEQKKVSFSSLKTITAAYRNAFVSDLPNDIFPRDTLERLEALRNLYAHRGGKVDLIFKRRWRNIETIHPLEIGQNYVATGDIVREHMDSVVKTGSDLIRFAEKWINAQPGGAGSQQHLGVPST